MTDNTARASLEQVFLLSHGWGEARIEHLAGDASFRSYKRLFRGDETAILMDAPPPKENVIPFINVAEFLCEQGFSAPCILGKDEIHGFLLLENLGDDLYNRILHSSDPNGNDTMEPELYQHAIDTLLTLHQIQDVPEYLSPYDTPTLLRESLLFVTWYLPLITGKETPESTIQHYVYMWNAIFNQVTLDTNVVTLRDYHADNLLWLPQRDGIKKVGLLDFQDALCGDAAYDLVSLLEDARRDVSPQHAEQMIHYYLSQTDNDPEQFKNHYAVLGAQRNLKIIGIFSRLALQDNNPSYLQFIPRVWNYLTQDIKNPYLSELQSWLEEAVPPSIRTTIPSTLTEQKFHG